MEWTLNDRFAGSDKQQMRARCVGYRYFPNRNLGMIATGNHVRF